jgi:hypothetical protein
MSVTDSVAPDPLQPEPSRRWIDAMLHGRYCGQCFRDFAPGEPVWLCIRHTYTAGSRDAGALIAPVCRDCWLTKKWDDWNGLRLAGARWAGYWADRFIPDEWGRPCAGCGRIVVSGYGHSWRRDEDYWHRGSACSEDCRDKARADRRADRRREAKKGRTCEVDGNPISPAARAGARYCSPACRQKAYRQRAANGTANGP